MTGRRTILVHTRLGAHMARVAAARAGTHGVRITTMSGLAARLAGGFLQPIGGEDLHEAIRRALPVTDLGELDPIKTLPGMVRAAAATLEKVWQAGLDLSSASKPRLAALASLERAVLSSLPPSMKRPRDLVALARERIGHAPAVIGPVEVHGHSEMPACWRELLVALADVVPVVWVAGPRHVPAWLAETRIGVTTAPPTDATPSLFSCATARDEVLEAFRWMRGLLAEGRARPHEIGIAAASPGDYDDLVLAMAREANLPLHVVHGVKAVTTPDGQTAAALADIVVGGLSQERVRRLFARLAGSPALAALPPDWTRLIPRDAPLTTVERWERVFASKAPADWPDGIDRSDLVLDVLRVLARGLEGAAEAGERLLGGTALGLWRRALDDGPAAALPVTLQALRVEDGRDAATHAVWASAASLASAPRPFVRLVGLNAGRWPRRISEDRLIPDHIVPIEELDPLPLADADRRDFVTLAACASTVTISYARRDVEGRLLGKSPLISDLKEVYLGRARVPEHAASEADRLWARPSEFRATALGRSARACWENWYRTGVTAHDGLVGRAHPRLGKALGRTMSATSLKLLLRDPIRFTWKYALGWKQPEDTDEPLTLAALAIGNLVHEVLRTAVVALEAGDGLAQADDATITAAIARAVEEVAAGWETEQPVPPGVLWQNAKAIVRAISRAALTHPMEGLAKQRSWTEVPFGTGEGDPRNDLPWNPQTPVVIPGTGITISGYIDRLDLSGDGSKARVIDYKTGFVRSGTATTMLGGGKELQRCLYALAVRSLLGADVSVEAALMFPRAGDGAQALFPLADPDSMLARLTTAVTIARDNLASGLALPGEDTGDTYNDYAFALPSLAEVYLARKREDANARLGTGVDIWGVP